VLVIAMAAGAELRFSPSRARGECRTYAKVNVEGDSLVTLSPQEQQAFAAARTGKGGS
jgi:hypothetical protein